MKFMKLGTRPDTFYAQEAIRTLVSDVPTDLTIRINNITYLLHKLPLLKKCGLLQRLCSGTTSEDQSGNVVTVELHDIPGGENAFELCAKFCYGITINLSANNFVHAFCAAKFLRMTETVDKGNFIPKLEAFFTTCILQGWKDSIVALQSTAKVPEWSENLGIIRGCIDSILDKILKPPAKVTWSFTYTRLGYERNRNQSVPKDWWTEDVSDLDLHLFRCIITAVLRPASMLPPQLIGEALHVYACRWLPDITNASCRPSESSTAAQSVEIRNQQILETIVSLIPVEGGCVSIGFLLRLLRTANFLGVSSGTKAELVRRSGQQLEEAKLNELLIPLYLSDHHHHYTYDIELVRALVECFLRLWRRKSKEAQSIRSIINVGKLIDSYLQVVAADVNMSVQQLVSLAAAVPEIARPQHDQLYKAINIYLREHPELTKADKKQLCRILDCQKLSPEVRSDMVRNERLPLRTVVQVLFFDKEKRYEPNDHQKLVSTRKLISSGNDDHLSNLRTGSSKQISSEAKGLAGIHVQVQDQQQISKDADADHHGRLQRIMEAMATATYEQGSEKLVSAKGKEIRGESVDGRKLEDDKQILRRRTRSQQLGQN